MKDKSKQENKMSKLYYYNQLLKFVYIFIYGNKRLNKKCFNRYAQANIELKCHFEIQILLSKHFKKDFFKTKR